MTALRPVSGDRVAVDLDGERWRVVPAEAVHRAGLAVGCELDRQSARTLRGELRRAEARRAALSALRHRDHSTVTLRAQLERQGIARLDRDAALELVQRAGFVDDERFAHRRAAALAERGCGDLLVADDLERRGIPAELVAAALAALEPEAERAARFVAAHGATTKTLRRLAAKGFATDVLEGLVADAG